MGEYEEITTKAMTLSPRRESFVGGSEMKFDDIEHAYFFASAYGGYNRQAYVNRKTGVTYCHSDDEYGDELPEDIADSDKYVAVPDQYELNLGKALVDDFVSECLPDDYDEVQWIFARKGAYGRYRSWLDRKGMLQQWYEYEDREVKRRLREWCERNNIDLTD